MALFVATALREKIKSLFGGLVVGIAERVSQSVVEPQFAAPIGVLPCPVFKDVAEFCNLIDGAC